MERGTHQTWFIPDMYLPAASAEVPYVSHEAVCVLNASAQDATLTLDLYFEDRDPLTGFTACCAAKRTNHIRMDTLTNKDGLAAPRGVPYAAILRSDLPVVVQYTRVDTTPMQFSLMTTMAFPI